MAAVLKVNLVDVLQQRRAVQTRSFLLPVIVSEDFLNFKYAGSVKVCRMCMCVCMCVCVSCILYCKCVCIVAQ